MKEIWNSENLPFYNNKNYADIVAGFDSVYISFYKDIGSIGGALLAGSKAFIDDARQWRTRLGGFSVGSWPLIYDALHLIDKRIEQMPAFVEKAKILANAVRHIDGFCIDPLVPHTNLFHILLDFTITLTSSFKSFLGVSSRWICMKLCQSES